MLTSAPAPSVSFPPQFNPLPFDALRLDAADASYVPPADDPTPDDDQPVSPQLAMARRLLKLGCSVIPCDHPAATTQTDPKLIGKVALVKWKPYQTTHPTDDDLVSWFDNGHPRNVALVTGKISGFVVVDLDSPEAETWAKANLPPTKMRTRTGSGRAHLFYRHPGHHVSNRSKLRTPDGVTIAIDVRGDGGYIVGPGSLHFSGRPYEIEGEWPESLDMLPVFDQAWHPDWLEDAPAPAEPESPFIREDGEQAPLDVQPYAARLKRARAYVAGTPVATTGQAGDTTTFKLACSVRIGFGISADDTLRLLRKWNKWCEPPWEDADLIAKVKGARAYAKEPKWGRARQQPQAGATAAPVPAASGITSDDPPAAEAVDGAALLEEVRTLITRYMIISPDAAIAITLWIMLTWCEAYVNVLAILLLISPTKQCGKTRAMMLLEGMVRRALLASNLTASTIFRVVQQERPTLLIDEADTFVRQDEALRGVINSGHTRRASTVIRNEVVGKNFEPKLFSTWAPKAIAGIHSPPDTIVDRSIVIKLQRKQKSEVVARLRQDRFYEDCAGLRQRFRRWADDHGEALRTSEPDDLETLNDRASDNWRSLFAIADLIGGPWPALARDAARNLSGQGVVDAMDADDTGVLLLSDIRKIFVEQGSPEMLFTDELLMVLYTYEDRPWGAMGHLNTPMNAQDMASLLRMFHIAPKQQRRSGKNRRGYTLKDFADAWNRYLDPLKPETSQTAQSDAPAGSSGS